MSHRWPSMKIHQIISLYAAQEEPAADATESGQIHGVKRPREEDSEDGESLQPAKIQHTSESTDLASARPHTGRSLPLLGFGSCWPASPCNFFTWHQAHIIWSWFWKDSPPIIRKTASWLPWRSKVLFLAFSMQAIPLKRNLGAWASFESVFPQM